MRRILITAFSSAGLLALLLAATPNGSLMAYNGDAGTWTPVDKTAWTDVSAFGAVDGGTAWSATPGAWGWAAAGYRKGSDGRVYLRGGVSSGTDLVSAFTLPVGYRPTAKLYAAVACGVSTTVTTGVVVIGSDGTVTPNVGANTGWVSLGEISFYADQ